MTSSKSMKSRPTWPFSVTLPRLAITPLPRYSGQLRCSSSSTRTKPGGPARNVPAASAGGIRRGEEHHFLAADEVAHPVVEVGQDLAGLEGVGTVPGAESVLQFT